MRIAVIIVFAFKVQHQLCTEVERRRSAIVPLSRDT